VKLNFRFPAPELKQGNGIVSFCLEQAECSRKVERGGEERSTPKAGFSRLKGYSKSTLVQA
jgi:hypothetical protein